MSLTLISQVLTWKSVFVLFSLPVCRFNAGLSADRVGEFLLLPSLVVLLEGCNADPKSDDSEGLSMQSNWFFQPTQIRVK